MILSNRLNKIGQIDPDSFNHVCRCRPLIFKGDLFQKDTLIMTSDISAPVLTGTPKQIEWAEQVRAQVAKELAALPVRPLTMIALFQRVRGTRWKSPKVLCPISPTRPGTNGLRGGGSICWTRNVFDPFALW
jgi:hypothetical protein